MEQITKTALIATLVGNDFQLMHLYAKGDNFDELHDMTDRYCATLRYEADYLMELSMEMGIPVINPSEALRYIPNYTPEVDIEYNWETTIQVAQQKLGLYVQSLRLVRSIVEQTDIQSWLDKILRYWEKELIYKLVRRSESRPNMLNGFIDTGLDTKMAYRLG